MRTSWIERLEQIRIRRVLRIHRTQQRGRWELTTLVNPDGQRVFLGNVDFDPRTALGNHSATWQFPVRRGVLFQYKVDTRTTVQLANNHTLGTIDDELATTHHDRQVAQVDFFLNGLFAVQAKPNAQRTTIGQSKLAALATGVSRLAQFVVQVIQRRIAVITCDWEYFFQDRFQPNRIARLGSI